MTNKERAIMFAEWCISRKVNGDRQDYWNFAKEKGIKCDNWDRLDMVFLRFKPTVFMSRLQGLESHIDSLPDLYNKLMIDNDKMQ